MLRANQFELDHVYLHHSVLSLGRSHPGRSRYARHLGKPANFTGRYQDFISDPSTAKGHREIRLGKAFDERDQGRIDSLWVLLLCPVTDSRNADAVPQIGHVLLQR